MPLIMIGQKPQSQKPQSQRAEIRAEADFDINKKAEHEIEIILLHLESQHKLLLKILRKLDKNNS